MTWLKGQTTWGSLTDKLTSLICGESADDSAVTVAAGDQWIREIAGQNLLRAPASQDYVLPVMANRAGYWTLKNLNTQVQTVPPVLVRTVLRQKTLATGTTFSGSLNNRVYAYVLVNTPNPVAGNYSGCLLTGYLYDADNGTTLRSTSAYCSSDGTIDFGHGYTAQVSDPSGIAPSNTYWWRWFSLAYPGGVDYWPNYGRRNGSHTFTINPPGVSGTDWDVVEIPSAYYNNGQGLGIKTLTALTGARYTVSWTIGMKMRMVPQSGNVNGQVSLEFGNGGKVDTVYQNPTFRPWPEGYAQYAGQYWLRPYRTATSVTNGSAIQYWLSVKPTKIAIVLNADPGQSGKLTCAWLGKFTPYYPAWDVMPWFYGGQQNADLGDEQATPAVNTMLTLMQTKWRLDDISAIRDWQTGWMRSDTFYTPYGDTYSQLGQYGWGTTMSPIMAATYSGSNDISLIPALSVKPASFDNKWWLYGANFVDSYRYLPGSSNVNTQSYVEDRFLRGYLNASNGGLYLPGGGWGSGDELSDTVTGQKWFLVAADYQGIFVRYRTGTNQFAGGAAILEE